MEISLMRRTSGNLRNEWKHGRQSLIKKLKITNGKLIIRVMLEKESTGEKESMESQMDLVYSKAINGEWMQNGRMEYMMGE